MEQLVDQMAYYNDNYFNSNFQKHHPNDDSLICQNNTLYYYGDTKVVSGMIDVKNNERINLNRFKVSNINNNQWDMEPYQIFFYIRESVKVDGIDVKANIMVIYKLASKDYLEETDKFSLEYFIDYYNGLKSIENYLSGDLFDSLKYIKDILTTISSMDTRNISPGFRLIYEKFFGEIKNDYQNDSTGSSMGSSKTRSNLPSGAHFAEPIPTPSDYSNAAFISCVALVILILAIVIGTMTYIFS